MGALVRDGIRAQKAFARKIDMIYERLREETRRKKQCAEQEASSFFSAFDTELDSILFKVQSHWMLLFQQRALTLAASDPTY